MEACSLVPLLNHLCGVFLVCFLLLLRLPVLCGPFRGSGSRREWVTLPQRRERRNSQSGQLRCAHAPTVFIRAGRIDAPVVVHHEQVLVAPGHGGRAQAVDTGHLSEGLSRSQRPRLTVRGQEAFAASARRPRSWAAENNNGRQREVGRVHGDISTRETNLLIHALRPPPSRPHHAAVRGSPLSGRPKQTCTVCVVSSYPERVVAEDDACPPFADRDGGHRESARQHGGRDLCKRIRRSCAHEEGKRERG